MGQYTSYWLYQKYETRGSQDPIPCYPNVYSVDGDGTMPLVVRKEDDTQCGYVPPIVVRYRWVNIPITQDYVCDKCSSIEYRWVKSDETICIEDEPETEYRWVNIDINTDYYCEGTTKYYKQKKQQSSDGGQTWSDVVPAEYRKGDIAEEGSEDCGYIPPYENEFLFDDKTTVKNLNVISAGGSLNIGVISYVNGVQTDLYSLVEKDMWIQYNSHTATSFKITVERNNDASRDGILSLKQNQTGKIITLNIHQA